MMKRMILALAMVGGLASVSTAGDDLVIADFEGSTYGAWQATGDAFGAAPARGTLPGQMAVDGFEGKGLVNSFAGGDGSTGTLTSPPFRIERRYLRFLIGGGKDPERLALRLLVEGKEVRSATGPNDRAGGSEALEPGSWEVSDLAGKTGVIQIVDAATGGWGHLNVDQIVLTDTKPPGMRKDARRDFLVGSRYLHLPVRNGAKKRVVTLLADGKPVVRNDIELADGEADWWAPMDVSAWAGKTVTLLVDALPEDSTALSGIRATDQIIGAETLYREPMRGQIHFSPRRGWNNDPNGLVYFGGEYHLFFQHNPYGWGWGNMHWGHAVSKDLVRWTELGDVLAPDALGPMFSGSAVVDWGNTSGLGTENKAPLVLLYTAAGNPTVQCLAFSNDGRVFTKLGNNPVVPQFTGGNRDPKVMWHEPTKRWVMVLYVEKDRRHTVHVLTSPDLKDWSLASVVEGGTPGRDGYLYECPDFFELSVDGDPGNRKWVLLGANSEYAVGTFDGTRFTPEYERLPGHQGKGFYAPQTFANIPTSDGRRIQVGWFQTATPGMPFNQSMTVPQVLTLRSTADGPRLVREPVRELETLRARSDEVAAGMIAPGGANPLAGIEAELVELSAEFEPPARGRVTFTLRGLPITYDAEAQEFQIGEHRAPAPLREGRQRIRLYLDRTGLELFASDGLVYVPLPVNLDPGKRGLAVESTGGPTRLHALSVHELRSAWE